MSNGSLEEALNVHDLRDMARKRLPKWLFEFVDRGTEDEIALRNNRAAFERIKLKTQVLVDVSQRKQDITLFGKQHKMPIGIAPTGPAGMLWYKGILTPKDAELAIAHGADGVIVSNHGGRNFDSSMAPIEAPAPIVDAVGDRTTVIVDSGFRRGSDVVKALAIGAKLVMVGRATLWGTTVGGEAGAARALNFSREEISRTLAYLGCRSIAELNRDCLEFVGASHAPAAM